MKKTNTVMSMGKIIISLSLIPLWFINIFHNVAVLPSRDDPGAIVKSDFYYNMFQNISDDGLSVLAYISFALIGLTVILSALSLYTNIKCKAKICAASNILFLITIASFLVLLFMAYTVAHSYCY